MLTLYHTARAVCPQKVRLVLAEKGLSYESRLLAPDALRSPDYLAMNRNGYVPTLVDGEIVLTESRTISEYIEETFPGVSLMPSAPVERAMIRNWTKQIDDSLHLNIFILSFVASFRRAYLLLPAHVRTARLPFNPIKREVMLDLAEQGHESRFFKMAIDRFLILLDDMEQALSASAWLVAGHYSLADSDLTPYLRRLEEVGFWQAVRSRFPRVEAWFDAVRRRPSFAAAITGWETDEDRVREAQDIELVRPIFEAVLAK